MIESILAGELFTPTYHLKNALIQVREGKIVSVEEAPLNRLARHPDAYLALDGVVIPGLVDLQVNGALGWSFQAAHQAHIEDIFRYHLQAGTTTLLPTLVTAPVEVLEESLRFLAGQAQTRLAPPFVAGIHLEGPFLSPEKRGAHDEACLRLPEVALARSFLQAAGGALKIFTLAPELEGAEEVIRSLAGEGVIVSAGHSAARWSDLQRALKAGLRMITHAGNASDWPHRAMSDAGFMSSEPGVVGALMADERLAGGVILDGFHFHPALLATLLRLKGPDRLVLVSDSSTVAGLEAGEYESGGLLVTVHPGGFATSGRGGGWLAGSTITLLQAVQRAVALAGIPLQQAVHMATLGPARLLGIESHKGVIAPGADADLLVLNPDLSLRAVIAGGKVVV